MVTNKTMVVLTSNVSFLYLQDALQAQMVIKKMNEMMDTTNKEEDARDATNLTDPASDQEKTVEVRI